MDIVLHQFAYSHFNEKARWALDFKGIAHARRSYLPGPHMGPIKKISGQQQTPVLQMGDVYVAGSAEIIDTLENQFPSPALYPEDLDLRRQALELQQQLDAELGPSVRTLVFEILLKHTNYIAKMFGRDANGVQRVLYAAMLPLLKSVIAKGNGVNPENVVSSRELVRVHMDKIAARVVDNGFLVGDSFSVAELTAAALLMPITRVEHADLLRPQPMPDEYTELVDSFADEPAIQWAQSMFARYR